MKRKMTVARAQAESAMAVSKTVGGYKVFPATFGHIHWLMEIRKNRIMHGKSETVLAMAEICFAFTQQSMPLQRITGAAATKRINELLMSSSASQLKDLFSYGAEQLSIHIKTLISPKKAPAQESRKPAARVRKR